MRYTRGTGDVVLADEEQVATEDLPAEDAAFRALARLPCWRPATTRPRPARCLTGGNLRL
jgi:hypothetical protein